MTVGELTPSRLSDRWGRRPTITLGLVLFVAQFVAMAVFHNFTPMALAFVVAGFENAL